MSTELEEKLQDIIHQLDRGSTTSKKKAATEFAAALTNDTNNKIIQWLKQNVNDKADDQPIPSTIIQLLIPMTELHSKSKSPSTAIWQTIKLFIEKSEFEGHFFTDCIELIVGTILELFESNDEIKVESFGHITTEILRIIFSVKEYCIKINAEIWKQLTIFYTEILLSSLFKTKSNVKGEMKLSIDENDDVM